MYASALKFCGAMELCGLGFPRGEPADHDWPDVEKQIAAQKAGLVIAIARESQPEQSEMLKTKGFVPVYSFTNPRTSNVGVLWIKDTTGSEGSVTRLPQYITANQYPNPMPGPPAAVASPFDEPEAACEILTQPTPFRDVTLCTDASPCRACSAYMLPDPPLPVYTG